MLSRIVRVRTGLRDRTDGIDEAFRPFLRTKSRSPHMGLAHGRQRQRELGGTCKTLCFRATLAPGGGGSGWGLLRAAPMAPRNAVAVAGQWANQPPFAARPPLWGRPQ